MDGIELDGIETDERDIKHHNGIETIALFYGPYDGNGRGYLVMVKIKRFIYQKQIRVKRKFQKCTKNFKVTNQNS
ncbi:hypothetical protein GCM10027035_18530 [Emticicia sediminis]